MSKYSQHTSCLTPEQMEMISMGSISPEEMKGIHEHAADCPMCAEVIETLSPASIPAILEVTERTNARIESIVDPFPSTPFYKDRRFYLSALVLLAILLGTLYYLNNNEESGDINGSNIELAENNPNHRQISFVEDETFVNDNIEKENETDTEIEPETDDVVHETDDEVFVNSENDNNNDVVSSDNRNTSTTLNPGSNTGAANVHVSRIDLEVINVTSASSGKRNGRKNGQVNGGNIKKGNYKLSDMPKYYGGDEALKEYLKGRIWDNVRDRDKLIGQTLAVYFDVTNKGKVQNPEVIGDIPVEIKTQIVKILSEMPKWKSGKGKGSITYTMAISFN